MTEIRKITLQFPSLRAFLAEYGERLSADGMLLRSEAPPAAGSTVDIEVIVAEGMRLLRARGETLWSGAAGTGGGRKAAAIRFQELDKASRILISRIVEQRSREGAEPFNLDAVRGPGEARVRDLTVPATVVSGEPVEAPVDSVFDLAEPPPETTADLFSGAEEAPAAARQPEPPVPLLADPEPTPFDLGEAESAAAGLQLDTAAPVDLGAEADPEPAAHSDLSDLFGGDEPEMAPARGRTEAFPPSFVDEVEAELEAAEPPETPSSSYAVVDTGELEARFGAPVEGPVTEASAESLVEMPLAPPVEVVPELEATPESAMEPAPASVEAAEPAPEPAAELEPAAEPEPPPEIDFDPAAEIDLQPAAESSPAASEEPPVLTGESLKVATAFNATHGPETVEIPIAAPPQEAASPAPDATEIPEPRIPAEEIPPPPVEMPAPVEMAPPVETPPPVEMPASPAPEDDNLLSIPEFSAPDADLPEVGEAQTELPSSSASLRGAASRSRHVGTYFLIALLVGALAVAGYFLMGMVRGGDGVAEPAEPAAEATVAAAPTPETPQREVPADASAAASEGSPGVSEERTATEPEPAAAEPAEAAGPTAPFTGLDRITWNETESETILTLVGDGAIASQQVELVPIAGEQPRLVIEVAGVGRPFQPATLEVGSSQVRRVRTGLQSSGALHVVVDLADPGVSVRDLAIRGSRIEVILGAE